MSAALALQSAALARAASRKSALARPLTSLAAIGDSMTYQNSYGSGWKLPYGFLTWAEILSGGGLYSPNQLNFGVSGDRTDQMLARVGSVVGASPDICVVLGGVNDIRTISPAESIRNLGRIYDRLQAAGVLVVAMPPIPVGIHAGLVPTMSEQNHLARIRQYIRTRSTEDGGLVVADATSMLVNHADPNGHPLGGTPAGSSIPTAVTYDGLHPSIRGAYWMGKAIADALGPRLGGKPPICGGVNDMYDPSANPSGSKLGTGLPLGTSGGALSNGATGSVPSGWTLRRQSAGGSVSGTFEARALANGQSRQVYRIDISGTQATGEVSARFYRQLFSGFQPGERVEGVIELEIAGVAQDALTEVQLQIADTTGKSARVLGVQTGTPTGTKFRYPNQPWTGVLRTNPIVLGNTTALDFVLSVAIAGIENAAATVRVTGARLSRCLD